MPRDNDDTLPLESGGSMDHDRPQDSAETLIGGSGTAHAGPSIVGRRFGSYRIEKELGRGGQGQVYLAKDERLGRRVALKMLSGMLAFSDAARLRFQREAEVASRLDHSGIARVYDMGESEGLPFIAMEFVAGEPLSALLARRREKRQSVQESAAIERARLTEFDASLIEQTARALHYAHEAGLVHRDIKPANIMVRDDESPCILDFGLAKDESRKDQTLTLSGDILGTPSYMSPEQLSSGPQVIDRRSDVYSLGVTLYECALLQRPFEAASRDELFHAICNKEPIRPRQISPHLPRDLEAIILTAIDKDRDRRYPTALALADDLMRFRAGQPVHARPAGRVLRFTRMVRRNPLPSALAAAVFFALLLAMTVFYVKGEEARVESEKKTVALEDRRKALADFERLADVSLLRRAQAEAEDLLPPSPAIVAGLESWIASYAPLLERQPAMEAFVADLRRSAAPYDEESRRRDHVAIDEEIADRLAIRERLLAMVEVMTEPERLALTREALAELDASLPVLESEGRTRLSWRFPGDENAQFQHDVMTEYLAELEEFGGERGLLATMRRRLDQSRRIGRETMTDQAAAWDAVRARVRANGTYGGLDLEPQLGLVPLGPDPRSGLEEFLHWLSHESESPRRDEDGRIAIGETTGVILVLVPGGSFAMGAQNVDPTAPRHDDEARSDETPIYEVELAPFFVAKYEFTQGQYLGLTGENPSIYAVGRSNPKLMRETIDGRHPVEHVSWREAHGLLRSVGLVMPTEAQWEYAARSGGDDKWSGTSRRSEMSLYANLAGSEFNVVAPSDSPDLRDDWTLHAPVGSFRPNAWGLHDFSGNVWEWCDEARENYELPPRDSSGLRRKARGELLRVIRGGAYDAPADSARCSQRDRDTPDYRTNDLGFRAARPLDRRSSR